MKVQVKVRTEYDEYQMLDKDWYGELSDRWEPGAIKIPTNQLPYQVARDYWRQNVYYIPAYDYLGDFGYHSKRGQSKGEIYREAMQRLHNDKKRLLAFYADDWGLEVITVTVYTQNFIELGSASCGGVESDGCQEYKQEIIDGLVSEALFDAKEMLKSLKSDLVNEEWEIEED